MTLSQLGVHLDVSMSAVTNFPMAEDFPDPVSTSPRKWDVAEVEEWADQKAPNRPSLAKWAERRGLESRKPQKAPSSGGVPLEEWDMSEPLNRYRIGKLLNLSSGVALTYRRDFPAPTQRVGVHLLWDPQEVASYVQDNAHLPCLAAWVGASQRPDLEALPGTISGPALSLILGRSPQGLKGWMLSDLSFPDEVIPGSWDVHELLDWAEDSYADEGYTPTRGEASPEEVISKLRALLDEDA